MDPIGVAISQLPVAAALTGAELLPIVQDGDTSQSTTGQLLQLVYARTPAEIAANITPLSYNYPPGDPFRYGATGSGSIDDSPAFTTALSIAQTVTVRAGFTYVITALTAAQAGQTINAFGATLLQKQFTNTPMLTLTGNGIKVFGGTWDGNLSQQTGGANVQFSHSPISIQANDCVVHFTTVQNTYGLGISGHLCNRANIAFNKITMPANGIASQVVAVYLDSLTANAVGNVIVDNNIDCTANPYAFGALIAGPGTHLFTQSNYTIDRNTIYGNGTAGSVGITSQTIGAGRICNNTVNGFDIDISGDAACGSLISNNRTTVSVISGAAYCIEVNGFGNTVEANTCVGGNYGINSSAANSNLNSNCYNGNKISGQAVAGISVVASSLPITFTGSLLAEATTAQIATWNGKAVLPTIVTGEYDVVFSTGEVRLVSFTNQDATVTFAALSSNESATASVNFNAQYCDFQANTIDLSAASSGRIGFVLGGDCQFSSITGGNSVRGPGSTISDAIGVYLENAGPQGVAGSVGTAGGNVTISGNTFAGLQFASQVYAASAMTYAGVIFDNNNCLTDVAHLTGLSDDATWGNYCTAVNNRQPQPQLNILDQASNLIEMYSFAYSNPNGNVTAGEGSKYINLNGGVGATAWQKTTGGNSDTGWTNYA